MTVEELRDKVKAVFNKAHSAQVHLVLKQEANLVIKPADLEDESTAPEVKELFEEFVTNLVVANQELQICNLSVADERVNAIYLYDYESYPEELGLFKNFDITHAVKTDKFNFNIDDLSSLYGYIIYLGSMQDGVVLFKKHYPISLIKRDSFLLGAIKAKERFELISGDDILRLNGTAQLLRVGDDIFVLDVKTLERNMGFTALIEKAAQESVEAIEKLDILEDIEVLKDTLEEISFSRRLSKVKKASPIFRLNISTKTIIDFTKNTPVLAGKFKYNEDGTKIRLDTKKSKEAFLKLMNDAFLHSDLTKQYYEASAKDNITAG